MFTGIIEEKGRISKIVKGTLVKIWIHSTLEYHAGDSIAVQGICLTVTDIAHDTVCVEAMKQTKRITTVPDWRVRDYVNLERALKLGDRLGGHILLGHVDETAKLIRVRGNEHIFQISDARYCVPKGSIGIDGVSLTIGTISKNTVSVSLIPHTLKTTTLGNLRPGRYVNIEYDYLAKLLISKP